MGRSRPDFAVSSAVIGLASCVLVLIGIGQPTPEAQAGTTAPNPPPPTACPSPATPSAAAPAIPCAPPQTPAGPAVWGEVGLNGFVTGLRPAPNGFSYDPLFSLYSDLNVGLLPNKRLYLFLLNDFWVQRTATHVPGVSQRQLNIDYGIAWNYWDSLELRVFGYALNNLNRGTSLFAPEGYKDGVGIENRYYFYYPDIYDVGRLGYLALGYYPSQALVGNNGQSFRPGLFARGYLTESLPTPFQSYVYGGLGLTAENGADPRLLGTDFGVAIRPVADRQNLEFRIGDALTDDLKANLTRNYVYGAVRLLFGAGPSPGPDRGAPSSLDLDWPQAWGAIGLPIYVASSRMAPNGVAFAPIFSIASDLNLGLLPNRKLYFFWDGDFWAQHSAPGITNPHQGAFDFSKREMDSQLGLAWNYFDSLELRVSGYALNNLNRGTSPGEPVGGRDGIVLENRYYFATPNPYDIGRSGYVGVGYIPAGDLVGGNGVSFHPGPFADAYLTRNLPIPWLDSYLYAGMQVVAQQASSLRLFATDAGWAIRPFRRWRNLEFRVGDNVTADEDGDSARNTIYGAVRLEFGPGAFGPLVH